MLGNTKYHALIDAMDLSGDRATAVNITNSLEKAIKSFMIKDGEDNSTGAEKIIAVTTDSPSTMRLVRKNLCASYPHIVSLPCILHVFNLLVKDIASHARFASVIKNNRRIVAYFHNNSQWLSILSDMEQEVEGM